LTPEIALGDSLAIVGWLVKHYYHVQWWFDLPAKPWKPRSRLQEDLSTTDFLLDFHWTWKEIGSELVNWPLP
jgi:hypothetical protein